ncbi:MAG: DUF4145 domain-containing protein [Desulfobulbaceae bacterium]|nr:DUF4145 domain-containing protein [Desulfobulbaceae bacterium]
MFAQQKWFYLYGANQRDGYGIHYKDREFMVSKDASCGEPTIWHGSSMIYPIHAVAEQSNADLPEEVHADSEEARLFANFSSRGAAALLRLAIQKLCAHLGQPGKNVNSDIAAFVASGLSQKVQQSLDCVRVIGNDAVHPGTIDLRDDIETVNKLCHLVNFIAHKTITEPREVEEIYNGLPADKLAGIENRDKK